METDVSLRPGSLSAHLNIRMETDVSLERPGSYPNIHPEPDPITLWASSPLIAHSYSRRHLLSDLGLSHHPRRGRRKTPRSSRTSNPAATIASCRCVRSTPAAPPPSLPPPPRPRPLPFPPLPQLENRATATEGGKKPDGEPRRRLGRRRHRWPSLTLPPHRDSEGDQIRSTGGREQAPPRRRGSRGIATRHAPLPLLSWAVEG